MDQEPGWVRRSVHVEIERIGCPGQNGSHCTFKNVLKNDARTAQKALDIVNGNGIRATDRAAYLERECGIRSESAVSIELHIGPVS